MKRTKRQWKYSRALKIKVAEEYLSGQYSYSVGAEEYGLKNKYVVKEFVRWYKENPDIVLMSKKAKKLLEKKSEKNNTEVSRLEEELALARLRAASLETLIEVAEDEFGIDIRKKSGAGQSND